jgi:hypothetical protein
MAPAEGAVVLYGVRGVGKTSILRAAADHAASSRGLVTVWTSAAKRQSYLPALATSIRRTLETNDIVKAGGWSLDEIGVSLGVGPAKVTASARPKREPGVGEWNVGVVENMLRAAATLCSEHGGALGGGMLLVMDEMQAASRSDLAILLNALQNIAHDRHGGPAIAFVAAGLPSVRGAITSAATFGERTMFRSITSLSQEATRLALTKTAGEFGVRFTDDAIERLWGATKGYPFFVQLFGYHAWESAQASSGVVIGAPDAEDGIKRAQIDVDELFAARYGSATKSEREMMSAVARLGGDQPVRRSDLAETLGRTSQAISTARSQLIDKAVLTEEERGFVQFTLPGFAEFVLSEA